MRTFDLLAPDVGTSLDSSTLAVDYLLKYKTLLNIRGNTLEETLREIL